MPKRYCTIESCGFVVRTAKVSYVAFADFFDGNEVYTRPLAVACRDTLGKGDRKQFMIVETAEQFQLIRGAIREERPAAMWLCGIFATDGDLRNASEHIIKCLKSYVRFEQRRWPAYWLFGPNLWDITDAEKRLSEEELRLAFLEALDSDRQKWERLKNKFSGTAGKKVEANRPPIPESVRIFVWRRDQGKCVQCGSNERLEFDHIIPVIEGGSSTERNVQLLCEPCNRRKSDSI